MISRLITTFLAAGSSAAHECTALFQATSFDKELVPQDTMSLLDADAEANKSSSMDGAELSQHLFEGSQHLPDGPTKQLLESFRICGHCANFRRYGEANDGGYLTCLDPMPKAKAALSVGVEQHDQWSADTVKNHNIPVGQFDCTVDAGANCQDNCEFYKICLVGDDGRGAGDLKPTLPLDAAVTLAAHGRAAEEGSLLLKIDCEGCEWPIFETAKAETLNKFSQIIVEFHWLNQEQAHGSYARAMSNLLAHGFKVVHLHGNNCCPMHYLDQDRKLRIPTVLEVTLVKDAESLPQCLTRQQLDVLDAPNLKERDELPAVVLEDP